MVTLDRGACGAAIDAATVGGGGPTGRVGRTGRTKLLGAVMMAGGAPDTTALAADGSTLKIWYWPFSVLTSKWLFMPVGMPSPGLRACSACMGTLMGGWPGLLI